MEEKGVKITSLTKCRTFTISYLQTKADHSYQEELLENLKFKCCPQIFSYLEAFFLVVIESIFKLLAFMGHKINYYGLYKINLLDYNNY